MAPRPYRSPARDAAGERTRARIVAAATKLLRSAGTGGFSLEAVAKRAKVTRLTVYNQFGSRQALFEAVFDDRAMRGGLHRLGEAMGNPDPQAGLYRLIEIFCDFWSYDRGTIARLQSVMTSDAEFEASLRARNERRRHALAILVARMVERGDMSAKAAADITDLLFVLTSFPTFAELTAGKRTDEGACALVQAAARRVIENPSPAP